MALVKSSGSSHRKGKEVVYNPPIEQETGEEAVYSESNHSDEEEARCDPDSECAPLIDLWYNVYPSFPKIPSDYVLPPPSRVARSLTTKPQYFLSSVVFLHLRSSHSPRHFTPYADPF